MKIVAKLLVWILLLIMQEEKITEGYPRPNVYLHTQILYTYMIYKYIILLVQLYSYIYIYYITVPK